MEATLDSVACQSARGSVEYIVVDGGSGDGTRELLASAAAQGTVDKWVSEADGGIYPAMNRGLELATGQWVWFLNAGDCLLDQHTVQSVLNAIAASPEAGVVYGETLVVDAEGRELGGRRLRAPERLTAWSLLGGMRVCHQAFVARRERAPKYDTQYHWSADYDWVLRIVEQGAPSQRVPTLVRYLDGGATKRHIPEGLRERFRIMTQHFGLLPAIGANLVLGVRFLLWRLTHKWY